MFPCFSFDHERTEAPFCYFSKPSRGEREAGCDHLPAVSGAMAVDREEGSPGSQSPGAGAGRVAEEIRNVHPTVKSIALMRWLCRLITPPGGTVLDPFLGSGTTGCAAALERFDFIGIEREAEYVAIAEARIAYWARQSPTIEKPTKADGPLPGQLGLFG
jgi:site-specific DNA-methyltransferase (adenine-specific)